MELRFVSTGSIHFRTGVDQELGLGTTPDKEMEPFLGTEQAVVGAKGFHCAKGRALPHLVKGLDVSD